MTIYDLVNSALSRQQVFGIVGWGLDNPDANLFDCVEEGPAYGCTSETCHHNSHDPAAPTFKLIPRRGALVRLSNDDARDYYSLVDDEGRVLAFVEINNSHYYWASAYIVESVPDWCLTALVR